MTEHDIQMVSGEGVSLSCDLSVLDETQRKRRFVLAQLLQVGTSTITDLADGYAFHVDSDSIIAKHLEEFAVLARLGVDRARTKTGGKDDAS